MLTWPTRETPAFGGISLTLRGAVASAPILETAAFGGGKRIKKKYGCQGRPTRGGGNRRHRRRFKLNQKIWAPVVPQMVLKTSAGS